MEDIINQFEQALYNLDKLEANRLLIIQGNKLTPLEIISKIVVPALERIGNSWQEGRIALSQIYEWKDMRATHRRIVATIFQFEKRSTQNGNCSSKRLSLFR